MNNEIQLSGVQNTKGVPKGKTSVVWSSPNSSTWLSEGPVLLCVQMDSTCPNQVWWEECMADCTSSPIKGVPITMRTMQEVHLQVSSLWTGHLERQWEEDDQCDTGPRGGSLPGVTFSGNSLYVDDTLEMIDTHAMGKLRLRYHMQHV